MLFRSIRAYEQRCLQLRRDQERVKEARANGYKGTDRQILEQLNTVEYQERVERIQAEELANSLKVEAAAVSYLESVFAIPNVGDVVQRWLKGRIDTMGVVELRLIVSNFMNRETNTKLLQEAMPYLKHYEVALKAAA